MKTLLLMRHAKSSWKHPELQDYDRPLSKRGLKDAPSMGKIVQDRELVPELILSSPALRAQQTAELVSEACGSTRPVEYINEFYLAEPQVYLDGLHALSPDLERVMLIGHNPGLEGLLQMLSGQVASLPTAAIAHLVLPIQSWEEVNNKLEGELVELWRPRDLK
jgi:phosphohistidine phosphatase